MALVENDDLIEQIAAATPDESLSHAILPRALRADSFGLNAEALDGFDRFFIEVRTMVEDQIARCRVARKGLAQLLNHPCGCRMFCSIEVHNTPPVARDDEEAIKHTKRERWHSEEVH
jgi:hypothetical protein